MFRRTDDLRITDVRPLIPPAILLEEIPISERASNVVANARTAIAGAIEGRDPRLVVVAGPCSIHDPRRRSSTPTACSALAVRYADHLIVVMRSYFEKPRTTVGWKGFINDPDLDESFHINKGLRLARQLLLDVNDMGLPTGSEFLDTQIPQHIADLTSWVAIGARTMREPGAPRAGVGAVDAGRVQERHRRQHQDGGRRRAVGAAPALVPVGHQAGRVGDLPDHRQRHLPRDPARRQPERAELPRREHRRAVPDTGQAGPAPGGDDRLLARQQREGSPAPGDGAAPTSPSRSPAARGRSSA